MLQADKTANYLATRFISQRTVIAYKTTDDEDNPALAVLFFTDTGTNVSLKYSFDSEEKCNDGFAAFKAGESDASITKFITSTDEDFRSEEA